jgi:hypothetical protein
LTLRRLLSRPPPEWSAAVLGALASIQTAVRDRLQPPKVVPRKEATYEGITFRVPTGYNGSVWDDLGLGVSLHADTLEPVSARMTFDEKCGFDVVQVAVRWEDWDRISGWVRDASALHGQDDTSGNAYGEPAPAGLRRSRAPQGTPGHTGDRHVLVAQALRLHGR